MVDLNIKPPVDVDNPTYYINKEQMRLALKEYKTQCELAEANGQEVPRVPEYLGDCFLKIARGLGMKYNFRQYSFLNDMIGDAVMTCLKRIRSYDPDRISDKTNKPTSAFSYFTRVCWYEFLAKIKEEDYEASVKWALFMQSDLDSFVAGADEAEDFKMDLNDFIRAIGPQKHLQKKEKKKKPTIVSPLDEL
jgi:hypothetical protein